MMTERAQILSSWEAQKRREEELKLKSHAKEAKVLRGRRHRVP